MKKPNDPLQFLHSVTFVSSGGKRIGKSHKTSFDAARGKFVSSEDRMSLRKQSDIGVVSTPISPISAPRFAARKSSEQRQELPRALHLEFKDVPEASPSLPVVPFLEEEEDSKETGLERASEKSTFSETPHESPGFDTTKSLYSGLTERRGKEECEFRHHVGPTHKAPSMLALSEKQLSSIVTGATSTKGELKRFGPRSSPAAMQAYREFLYYLFESVCLIKQIVPAIEALPEPKIIDLQRPKGERSGKTVVFDLDETLVHGVEKWQAGDIDVTVTMPDGETSLEGVNLRPLLLPLLEEISKLYEVVVFTSSYKEYADAILDCIDKDRRLIHHRLYREHCVRLAENLYIKDLRVLGRDLKDVIIVDNSPYAFAAQMDNGCPIIPYYEDHEDKELQKLARYLKEIKDVEDIRVVNREKFKLADLSGLSIEQYAQYYHQSGTEDRKSVEETVEFTKLQQSLKHFFKDWK